ncbi:MAG: DUF4270 domain-containing protein [Flavobacterium sp.]
MHKRFLCFCAVLFGFYALLVSCDKDFLGLDSDIIGSGNYQFSLFNDASIKAYMQDLGPVQSNNMDVNPLGIYNHPVFGKNTAHFVTQLELSPQNFNPTFGDNIEVESVLLTVPYFNRRDAQGSDGASTFVLDSIYGVAESKMKLNIYENGFFLRALNPGSNFTQAERYYTNQQTDFDNVRLGADAEGNAVPFGSRLNNSEELSENDEFFFDRSEVVIVENEGEDNETTTRRAPEMRINLNNKYFEKKIFSPAGATAMTNNNTFRNYFRGLYFNIEQIPGEEGELALLNFKNGRIFITYSEDSEDSEGVVTRVEKFLELNLTGNTVSLQDFTNINPVYQNALSTTNSVTGDPKLFLKGGVGSSAIIELFGPDLDGNGIADQLEEIRNNGWMINEANLTFYIDREGLGTTEKEPTRVMLYDLNNKRPLVDYFFDQSRNASKPKFDKVVHGGIIEKDLTDQLGRGKKYKIRITNHINNLIRTDSTNVKLGLVVTEDVRILSNAYRRNPQPGSFDRVPLSSVMSPSGTILFGNHPMVPEDKKLKLEIYYTKPN